MSPSLVSVPSLDMCMSHACPCALPVCHVLPPLRPAPRPSRARSPPARGGLMSRGEGRGGEGVDGCVAYSIQYSIHATTQPSPRTPARGGAHSHRQRALCEGYHVSVACCSPLKPLVFLNILLCSAQQHASQHEPRPPARPRNPVLCTPCCSTRRR